MSYGKIGNGHSAALDAPCPDYQELASAEPSPPETLESRATQQSLREAIEALSETERQVLLLYCGRTLDDGSCGRREIMVMR